jgi:flagellar basal body-associated protein FliL
MPHARDGASMLLLLFVMLMLMVLLMMMMMMMMMMASAAHPASVSRGQISSSDHRRFSSSTPQNLA